jgi:NitT/TauT family transport system substrate-binding protein
MGRLFFVRSILAILVASCVFVVAAESPDASSVLLPVRLALQWLPQSQFAGYYMARDQGFYRDAGLDVTLLHTGPGPSALDFMEREKADFATLFLADAIAYARTSVPLVHIGQFVKQSNLMLVARKDAGIEKPSDLDGKRVSYWPGTFSIAFQAFFQQYGIEPVSYPQHHSINLFLGRGVDACAAMYYNEYHQLYLAGIDYESLTTFLMRDHGLGFPEDGLYTSVQMATEHPEVCRALREATLAGWAYAREHPDVAIDAVLRASRAGEIPANRPHSRWMLERILASIFPSGDSEWVPGQLDPEMYHATVKAMKAAGLLEEALPFEVFAPAHIRETP